MIEQAYFYKTGFKGVFFFLIPHVLLFSSERGKEGGFSLLTMRCMLLYSPGD